MSTEYDMKGDDRVDGTNEFRRPRAAVDSAEVTDTLASGQSDQARERESANAGESNAKGPFGGLTATEAQARSAQRRRERKVRAQQLAEMDKLAVQARVAYALANCLKTAELLAIVEALIHRAIHGSGHVANAAAQLVFSLAQVATEDIADAVPEGVPWEELTPAQRAAARAQIDRELLRLAELPETEADSGEQIE
jgi:hypothetical protein